MQAKGEACVHCKAGVNRGPMKKEHLIKFKVFFVFVFFSRGALLYLFFWGADNKHMPPLPSM